MGSAAAAVIGTPLWNAELYGSLSVSSRLSALISSQAAQFKIGWFLWQLNRKLEAFLGTLDKSISDVEHGRSTAKGDAPKRETVEKSLANLMDLYRILDGIHSHCVRHRLMNVSRLAWGLKSLRSNADRIEEIASWLNDATNPQPDFRDAFAKAQEEFEKGETVPASEVCH
jgi:hypothetical protein